MRPNSKQLPAPILRYAMSARLDKSVERLRLSQEAVLREIGAVQRHAAELRSAILGIEQKQNSEARENLGTKRS